MSKAIPYNPITERFEVDVLDIRQAADYLGIDPGRISKAITSGDLRVYRPVGVKFMSVAMPLYHIRVDDLRHWFFGA